ncbi:cell division protein FtsL [Nevskia soli]|uniref:cell division protein FtsL n=1 Tax=Nevskia soli TaxID=418856 RepID=UPI001FE2217A|nr:cell division protein FtsL [Nevskia soli]
MSASPNNRAGGSGGTFTPLLLGVLVMISAVAVVQVKQHSRNLTTRLDGQRQERERLQLEWAQLQLEQATLAQHGRVDELARSQFGMVDPLDYQIVSEVPAPGVPAVMGKPQ